MAVRMSTMATMASMATDGYLQQVRAMAAPNLHLVSCVLYETQLYVP